MGKKLSAKVNGVKVEDDELVTLVVQAKVKVHQSTSFGGERYTYVTFNSDPESESEYCSAYIESDTLDKKDKVQIHGLSVIKVKS